MKFLLRIILSELRYLWWLNLSIIILLLSVIIFDGSSAMETFEFLQAKNLSVLMIFVYLMSYNTLLIYENRVSFFQRLPLPFFILNLDRIFTGIIYVFAIYFILSISSFVNDNFSSWSIYELINIQSVFILIMSLFTHLNTKILDKDKEYPVYSGFGSIILAISATAVIYGVLFSKNYLFCFSDYDAYKIQSFVLLIIALIVTGILIMKK
jgi:hypothetical protein